MSQINLKRNILLSGSFRVAVMILTFVTSVISTRYLGVELKGKLSYLTTLSGFIWVVLDMGLYRSFPYLVRKFPDKIGSMFGWTIIQFIFDTVALLILGFSLLPIWNAVIGYTFSPLYIMFFICMITFPQLAMQLQSLYLGLNKIWKHSFAQIINSMLMLILVVIGYFFVNKIDRLAYIIIATMFGSMVCIIYYTLNHDWQKALKSIDFRFILSSYKSGFRVFLSTLFIILLIRFDIIIIKRMLDFKQVGIYSLAAHIVDLLQVASNLVGGLLLVKLSDSDADIEKWKIMKKLLMSFFVILCVANLGFVILGKFLIATLYGVQFVPVYYAYLWLIPASLGLSFGSLFNMYLNSKGFPIISIILPAIALIVNVMLNFILIPYMGIYGSALATSVAYVLWFVMIIAYEQRCSNGQMFKHLVPDSADWRALWQETLLLASDTKQKLLNYRMKK